MGFVKDGSTTADLLAGLLSVQDSSRQQAESFYQQAVVSEPENLFVGLLASLVPRKAEQPVRFTAAVLLRQLVTQGDFCIFPKLHQQRRQELAKEVLAAFCTEVDPKLQQAIGNIVCKIAETACDTSNTNGWLCDQGGWPDLLSQVFCMANPASSPNADTCTSAMRLLKELVSARGTTQLVTSFFVGQPTAFQEVLMSGVTHAEPQVRCASFLLICSIVVSTERNTWAPFRSFLPTMHKVLQQFRAAHHWEFQQCLQAFIDVAAVAPPFFKSFLLSDREPATFLATIARTCNGVDIGLRVLALEWLVAFVEKATAWGVKSLADLAMLAVGSCMEMMLAVDESEGMECWAARMERDCSDEDSDELFRAAEHAIARVIGALGMQHIGNAVCNLISHFASHQAWQHKQAALAAIKQAEEFVEEPEHMNKMATLVLDHTDHTHPRVQYAALNALGHLGTHQAPQFQDAWHKTVMSMLLRKVHDPLTCNAEMAMVAFIAFSESLDKALMMGYSREFMQAFGHLLFSSSQRNIQQQCISSIAVIASVIEDDFAQYYNEIMPVLKRLVIEMPAADKTGRILRGKAFECMSVIGAAVGKAHFLPDASNILAEMMKTSLVADDEQREYISDASQRICKCLKEDFAPFLPAMLPVVFAAMQVETREVSGKLWSSTRKGSGKYDADRAVDLLKRGAISHEFRGPSGVVKSKVAKVRTDKVEQVLQSIGSLLTFCTEMEDAFFDYVPQTAEALLPFLETMEDEDMLSDEVRSAAFQTWASLVECASSTVEAHELQSELPRKLLHIFLQKTCAAMDQSSNPEYLRDASDGIAACLRNIGDDVLSGHELLMLAQKLFALIDISYERSSQSDRLKLAAQGDEVEEGCSNAVVDDEDICRRGYEEALGAAIKAVAPSEFLPCLPECGQRMSAWFAKKDKLLALWLACDLLEHLKEKSIPLWSIFMPHVFQVFNEGDFGVQTAGALAINNASLLEGFEEAAPEAFRTLAKVINGPAPGQQNQKAQLAMDVCVSALLALLRHKASYCPPEIPAWQLVVSKLPLTVDEVEAQTVHGIVADLVLEQHAGLLGPGQAHLGRILSSLAEVYRQEDLSTKRVDAKILKIFGLLPLEVFSQFSSAFTEKQTKKIELMLSSKPVS